MRTHYRSRQGKAGQIPLSPHHPYSGRTRNDQSGAALIIALAILLVLLSLAITFFLIVRFETNIARQSYDRAQAGHLLDAALAQAQYRLNRDLEVHGDALSLDHGWRSWFSGAAFEGKEWARNSNNRALLAFSIESVEQALRGPGDDGVLYAFFPEDRYMEPLFRGPRTEHWLHVPRQQREWILIFAAASRVRLTNSRGVYLDDLDENGLDPDGDGNDFTTLNERLQDAGRPERFARWTKMDVQNKTTFPSVDLEVNQRFYPDFITPAFFTPDDPTKDDDKFGLPEDIVNNFADVDSDGDGMKDAVWMPLSRDINHHGDGIDNDLDGNADPLGPNGESLFEAAPFVYHGWGLPEADPQGLKELRPIPWNLRERLVDGRGDGLDNNNLVGPDDETEGIRDDNPRLFLTVPLPGLVMQVDLNSDGVFDDLDHYQVEDAGGNPVYLSPLFVRLPDALWVTVITGEDNSGTETYARAAVTIEDVDVLDNDFDLTVNNFRSYAYLGEVKPGYHNIHVESTFAQDGLSGRQNLQFFCLRWDEDQKRYVQEGIKPGATLIDALRVSCTPAATLPM